MGVYCVQCVTLFSNQSNFNRHKRNVHGINDTQAIEYSKDEALFKCLEGCDLSFKYNMDLRQHLEKRHNIPMEILEKTFATYEEFELWLRDEEKNEDIRYEKSTGSKKRGNKTIERIYFDCVRSGKQRIISEQNLKRTTKKQGSSKMNKHCTSQIIVVKDYSGECTMRYFKNHYGHGHDVQHLRLSKITRENIASKLIMGVSSKHIVDSTRDNITLQLKRDDLLSKSDIKNIKNSFNIHLKDEHHHKRDILYDEVLPTYEEQIKSAAFQIIENVSTKSHCLKDLQLILKKVKAAELISCKSINHNIKSVAEPVNKKIDKQLLIPTKKPNKEQKNIKEFLTSSLYTSNDPRNDHLY